MGDTRTWLFFMGLPTLPFRNQSPWFDTRISYNPAIHRMKQALFHSAVTQDLVADPLPQPHDELTKYFEPPKTVLKRAEEAIDNCRTSFAIKKGLHQFSRRIMLPHCVYSTEKSGTTTQERPCARSRR
jgi:hypothetical protein